MFVIDSFMVDPINESWQNLFKFNLRDNIDGVNEFKSKTIDIRKICKAQIFFG